jgi:methylated-DNA-[protein]-cysteine S-methyltransferase
VLEGAAFETALGWVGLALSERGLRHLTLPRETGREIRRDLEDLGVFGPADRAIAGPIIALVERFAEAQPTDFSGVVLDVEGYPSFWREAWAVIRTIAWGETTTYGGVAGLMGSPRAARAVGTAVAHNPVSLVIPCHRVLASNGLGGYGGQEAYKAMLLRREGSWPRTSASLGDRPKLRPP